MDYRSLPRISNSDLGQFRKSILPKPGDDRPAPVAAFAFGSALHELVLEPHVIHDLPEVDIRLVQQLAKSARSDRFLKWALQWSQREVIQLWECPDTGLPLKSKLDIVHKPNRINGGIVVDIKTTSQRTEQAFYDSCLQYDYDRQAAFYMDSIAARRFVFVAIQKVKPFAIWHFECGPDFINAGRKKYRKLLREWKRYADAGQPFTPASWTATTHHPKPDTCHVPQRPAIYH
jgi:hypothetical protein